MDDLGDRFDVIVLGTGMTESILAAALSRIGKSVLHIDSNKYYGEDWASFTFDGLQNWICKVRDHNLESQNEIIFNEVLKDGEILHRINHMSNVWNVQEKWPCEMNFSDLNNEGLSFSGAVCDAEQTEKTVGKKKSSRFESVEDFMKDNSRKFNFDLSPKILFSRGALVELLISSNIAKYSEFKSVTRVLTWRNNSLEVVPCSRADVFSTKNITVVEKRLLVKILNLFLGYPVNSEELSGFENKTFLEYLKCKKLPDNIIHYVLYAMAMGDKYTPFSEGVKACKAFLESLGRYGNTPFIFPMYGSGELPQCFCRLSAVFGGTYCLKCNVEALVRNGERCDGVLSSKKRLCGDIYILSSNYLPENLNVEKEIRKISRGIFVTDRSILGSEKEPLTLLLFPPMDNISENSVTVVELGPGTNTCAVNTFIVHMTTVMVSDAESDLGHVVNALFQREYAQEAVEVEEREKPRVLWSLTWNVTQEICISSPLENVKFCSRPDVNLDYEFSINEARRIFKELCPGEDFLPRTPDSDEIVLDHEENKVEKEGGGEESTLEVSPVEEENRNGKQIE